MSISDELAERYATEVDVDWYEALGLSHPAVAPMYIGTHPEPQLGTMDGAEQTFWPVPFRVILPTRDANGRQDMSVAIGNLNREGITLLEQAISQPDQAIKVLYTVYLVGDPSPQIDPPIELALTDISVNEDVVTATATRSDILNLPFPREVYRPNWFPGLHRR